MITKTITLPLFSGFNESIFYNSNSLSDVTDYFLVDNQYELELDDLRYVRDVAQEFTNNFKDYLKYLPFIESIEFRSLFIPETYYYDNDQVRVKATLKDNWEEELVELADAFKLKILDLHNNSNPVVKYQEYQFDYIICEALNSDAELTKLLGYLILCQDSNIMEDLELVTADNCSILDYIKVRSK